MAARVGELMVFFDGMVDLFPASYYNSAEDHETDTDAVLAVPQAPVSAGTATSMSELRARLQAKLKEAQNRNQNKGEKTSKPKWDEQTETNTEQEQSDKVSRKQKGEKTKLGKGAKQTSGLMRGLEKVRVESGDEEEAPAKAIGKEKTKNKKRKREQSPAVPDAAKPTKPPNAVKTSKTTKTGDFDIGHDLQFSHVAQKLPLDAPQKKQTPKQALKKVRNFEKKIKEIKEQDPGKAAEIVHQTSFSSALQRAAGEKVHDDKQRISKAIKRKEKAKLKSKREWKEREKKMSKTTADAAAKRQENISAKLAERKAQRVKKSIKKRGDIKALLGDRT